MSVTKLATVVEIPAGFRHHATSVFAESWEAYDALTEKAGWTERTMGEDRLPYKTLGPWPSQYVAAHPPQETRPNAIPIEVDFVADDFFDDDEFGLAW